MNIHAALHAAERKDRILTAVRERGFISFRQLEKMNPASVATIRREIDQRDKERKITRVSGGVRAQSRPTLDNRRNRAFHLSGIPFRENVERNREYKDAIGAAAATACVPSEAIMKDGGPMTMQMCRQLAGLNLSAPTNSLHIVPALFGVARGARPPTVGRCRSRTIVHPLGIWRRGMSKFHARRLFTRAAGAGAAGVFQEDIFLAAAEKRLIERAEQTILLVDSREFGSPSGNVARSLAEVDVIITDDGIEPQTAAMIEKAGVELRVVPLQTRAAT